MSPNLNRAIAYILPPILVDVLRWLRRRVGAASMTAGAAEWEHVPDTDQAWQAPAGWNHDSITREQERKWPEFLTSVRAPRPFGSAHEAAADAPASIGPHNTIMTFGYALARAASGRRDVSVLDWGGGAGHYHVLAKTLLPELEIDYTVKDLPHLCEVGRRLNPDCRFVSSDTEAFSRRYDFVYASSSIHYTRDVYGLLGSLCGAASCWLMVTRLPVVRNHDDFVVMQRPYAYGYNTEYAGWFMNRNRLIDAVAGGGFALDREFLLDERPFVPNAPEQCVYGGFLFKSVGAAR